MNFQHLSRWFRDTILFSLAVTMLALPLIGVAATSNRNAGAAVQKTGEISGPFDGLNMKTSHIWINDRVYELARSVKVVGTSTKLGVITDIKKGERIDADVIYGEAGQMPSVIKIYRY